jgi:hypothetical protein
MERQRAVGATALRDPAKGNGYSALLVLARGTCDR